MRLALQTAGKLWFEYENYRRHLRFTRLSENEQAFIEEFNRDGCYLLKNAIGDDVIERIDNAIDDWMMENVSGLVANKRPDGTYPRLIGLHEEIPVIEELFSEEVTLKLQELLVGYRSPLFTSITFLQGSQQPLHRDIPVFRTGPENLYFRLWFALEDATAENGPLTGVKGGHRVAVDRHELPHKFYERFEEVPEQDPALWRKYQEALKQKYKKAGLVEETFELSRGDVLIWHPLFPHGGSAIENKRASRRSVVLHVSVASAFSETQK